MSKSCVLVNLLRGYKILLREIDKNRGANGATCDGDIVECSIEDPRKQSLLDSSLLSISGGRPQF
jgi:hypothetical protein